MALVPIGGKRITLLGDPNENPRRIPVCSIFPQEQYDHPPTQPRLTIPACPEDQPYVMFELTTIGITRDAGNEEGDYFLLPLEPEKRFADLVERGMKGIFLPAGPLPTEEELSTARATLDEFLQKMLKLGDEIYEYFGHARRIDHLSLIAARRFGEDRPWARPDAKKVAKCPGCNANIMLTTARCAVCQTIIDPKVAASRGQLQPHEVTLFLKNGVIEEADLLPKGFGLKIIEPPQPEELGTDAVSDAEIAGMRPGSPVGDVGARNVDLAKQRQARR